MPLPSRKTRSERRTPRTSVERLAVPRGLLERMACRTPLGQPERQAVIADLFHEGRRRQPFLHRFLGLMTLSSLIAVLGLLADSTAVVIGAMLVAPLMGPVLGVSAALVMDWPHRIWSSAITVAMGSGVSVGLAFLVSLLLPGSPELLSDELLARTSPTILDLGVALVAGGAGAFAKVRQQAADAIVGVAVAVALVPPLAVTGITLELGRYQMATGAFLLFLANVIGIVSSAAVAFVVLGLVPTSRMRSTRSHVAHGLQLAAVGTVAVVAPLQLIDQWRPEPTIDSNPQELVAETVQGWRTDVSVISVALERPEDSEVAVIQLTVASEQGTDADLGVAELAEDLALVIGEPVEVVLTHVESNVERAVIEDDELDAAEAEIKAAEEAERQDPSVLASSREAGE